MKLPSPPPHNRTAASRPNKHATHLPLEWFVEPAEHDRQDHGDLSARPILPSMVPGNAQDTRCAHGQTTVFLYAGIPSHAQDCTNQTRRAQNNLQPEPIHAGFHRMPGHAQCKE